MFTCIAVALGIGVGAALPAGASADIGLAPYNCATAPPHKALSYFGSEISATSLGATYFTDPFPGCSRFMVDISVGANKNLTLRGVYADVETGPKPAIDLNAIALSQSDCENYTQYVSVYTGEFILASTVYTGVWKPATVIGGVLPVAAHCARAWLSGSSESVQQNHSTQAVGRKFRVAVGAKITKYIFPYGYVTTYKQVKVIARPA
jgi:hypothetical protein